MLAEAIAGDNRWGRSLGMPVHCCGAVDVAQLTYVATNDVAQCPVAYTCRQCTFVDR